jgi:glycosyltransferase involved in cell wall biosynthesis
MYQKYRGQVVALLVPCFNEELAISKVISDFQSHMPELHIVVFDNNSTDKTGDLARGFGVRKCRKTHVF